MIFSLKKKEMKKYLVVKKESGNGVSYSPQYPRGNISGIVNNFSSNHKRKRKKNKIEKGEINNGV